MKIKELKKWFNEIPDKFDDVEIRDIDIDCTRSTTPLNLVIRRIGEAIIKTLFIKDKIIDYREKE